MRASLSRPGLWMQAAGPAAAVVTTKAQLRERLEGIDVQRNMASCRVRFVVTAIARLRAGIWLSPETGTCERTGALFLGSRQLPDTALS